MAATDMYLLQEQPFWQDLPDILQAQVLVTLDTAKRRAGMARREATWRGPLQRACVRAPGP